MLKRFSSAMIWTENLNNLLPFYRDTLGLNVAMQDEQYAGFGDGETGPMLGLGTHSEVHGKAADPYRHMIGFESDDVDADYRRLSSAGVEFIQEPYDFDGMRIATFKDPEGNLLQIFQMTRQPGSR